MNDVSVVDDMAMPAVGVGSPAGRAHQMRAADEQLEPVVVETHAQPVPDQAGGHAVEHLAQDEAAGRCHRHDRLLIVRCAAVRQRLQRRTFDLDLPPDPGVAAAEDLVDEAAIGGKVLEVAAAAQQ